MERLKELNSIGEFKTVGEAMEYCRIHGLDISPVDGNLFQIAGALMDARKDQHKITRQACADNIQKLEEKWINVDGVHTNYINQTRAYSVIMNTKAV